MTTEHIKTRRKLKRIVDVEEFNRLIDKCVLTDDYKTMLRMHYLKGKDFRYIGDDLGYSESTMKRWHKEALEKLHEILF